MVADKLPHHRQKRMVNWCPTLQTALSDIEVDHVEVAKPRRLQLPGDRSVEVGVMAHFAYPLEDGSGFIEVGEP